MTIHILSDLVTHGRVITSRQKHFAPDYEKGSRDKNRETQIRKTVGADEIQIGKTFGEVGQLNDDRKVEGAASVEAENNGRPPTPRSFKAFLEQASEIPPNQTWFG